MKQEGWRSPALSQPKPAGKADTQPLESSRESATGSKPASDSSDTAFCRQTSVADTNTGTAPSDPANGNTHDGSGGDASGHQHTTPVDRMEVGVQTDEIAGEATADLDSLGGKATGVNNGLDIGVTPEAEAEAQAELAALARALTTMVAKDTCVGRS